MPTPVPSGQAADSVVLRDLEGDRDYELCLDLQRATWGTDFRELVPPAILLVSQKVGGVLAGAFEGERLCGFVYGISGIRQGRLAHWSHMLAVAAEDRGRGLGGALKSYQRERLLERGVEVMYWTYDPLVARNANLNLNRLGAEIEEYVVDMYGDDTGSDVHSGLGTDRFVVRWELLEDEADRDRPEAGRDSEPSPPSPDTVLNPEGRCREDWRDLLSSDGQDLWVEIPRDIEALRGRDRDAGGVWRTSTRRVLPAALTAGLRVDGLRLVGGGEGGRAFYRLSARAVA